MLLSSAGGLILDFAVARLTSMKINFSADFSPLPFSGFPLSKKAERKQKRGEIIEHFSGGEVLPSFNQ